MVMRACLRCSCVCTFPGVATRRRQASRRSSKLRSSRSPRFPFDAISTGAVPPDIKRVCMVVYTLYDGDARVRREAETLAATGRYRVHVFALRVAKEARSYTIEGVNVQELNVPK